MKQLSSFLILISCWLGAAFGQTTHDVEYAQICLIDSIAPDTMNQFWRLTAANNPGEYTVDMTWDMTSSYSISGTVLPCCSCLTEATAMAGPGGWGDIAASNPAPINALLLFSGLVFVALLIPPLKIPVRKVGAILAILAFPLALSAQPGQAGTVYDIEYSCICLVDSIAADTINQFWRFTQANNPGAYTVDVTYDFASAYMPSGVLLSCKDYYLGDNPGGSGTANTLTMWTGPSSLGNSSVTQSGQILSSSFTGAFKPPAGTTAQQPAGVAGYLRYNSTISGFEGYNTAYRQLPWSDAVTFSANRIPYSNSGATALTSSSNLTWSNGLNVNTTGAAANWALKIKSDDIIFSGYNTSSAERIRITQDGGINFQGSIAGQGITWGNTGRNLVETDGTNSTGLAFNLSSSGSAANLNVFNGGNFVFQSGRLEAGDFVFNQVIEGVAMDSIYGWSATTPLFVSGFPATVGGLGNGGSITMKGGTARVTDNTGGSLLFTNGNQLTSGSTNANGTPGLIEFKVYGDSSVTGVSGSLYKIMTIDWHHRIMLYNRAPTTTGTQVLTMEGDTLKYRIENIGVINTSTDGSGDVTVTHSMGTTPTAVLVTPTGTTAWIVSVHTIGATTFKVRFYDAAGAAVTSTAVTATWLGKT